MSDLKIGKINNTIHFLKVTWNSEYHVGVLLRIKKSRILKIFKKKKAIRAVSNSSFNALYNSTFRQTKYF